MGTRSSIAAKLEDGSYALIYCHWDGYPSWNGKILSEHFTDPKKVAKLMSLGDVSGLHPKITKPKGHTFDNPVKGYTTFYGRDRGEEGQEAKRGPTYDSVRMAEDAWIEYEYLFINGEWYVSDFYSYKKTNKEAWHKVKTYLEAQAGKLEDDDEDEWLKALRPLDPFSGEIKLRKRNRQRRSPYTTR